MKQTLIIGAILLLLAGGFSLNRLIWLSPDYAVVGTCTADEIDKTYAGLDYANGFVYAAGERASHELWVLHGGMDMHPNANSARRWKRSVFDLNRRIFQSISKRNTAAYVCNHVTSFFGTQPRLQTVPQTASAIAPFVREPQQAWPVATCVATIGRCFGQGRLTQETVNFASERCADRQKNAAAKR